MGPNNMIKYAVRDMIKNHPDKLAERLSRILSPGECDKLFNGVVINVEIKDFNAFVEKYDLPVGKTHINDIKFNSLDSNYFTVYCTIYGTNEKGEEVAVEKTMSEYCYCLDKSLSDVYEVTYL